jgi:hypothetical protein
MLDKAIEHIGNNLGCIFTNNKAMETLQAVIPMRIQHESQKKVKSHRLYMLLGDVFTRAGDANNALNFLRSGISIAAENNDVEAARRIALEGTSLTPNLEDKTKQASFVCDFAYWNGVALLNSVVSAQTQAANGESNGSIINGSISKNAAMSIEDSTRLLRLAVEEFSRGIQCPHAIAGIIPLSIQAHTTLLSQGQGNDPGLQESLGE